VEEGGLFEDELEVERDGGPAAAALARAIDEARRRTSAGPFRTAAPSGTPDRT
jgi:hypothetical protein